MANKIIISSGKEAEFAEYKEQIIPDYRDNPFIEALPIILTKEEVIDRLAVYPEFDINERLLDSQYRIHILIKRLSEIFQPLPIHLKLENKISTMIRLGYVARNPFKKEYAKMFVEGYRELNNYEIKVNEPSVNTASSLSIIGVSGMGKSTSINRVLSNIPQLIVHKNYRGFKFSMYQLTWLKIDCSFDGSVKGLCVDFFSKIDNILGTNYFMKYGTAKRTVDTMLSAMAQIARNTGLGLLIIDEIQNLKQAKSGGSDKMLNFFTTLVNTVGIPIIFIGTMKARNILQSDFRIARRGLGNAGNIVWERMKKDDNWNLLIETIWEYQWTKNRIVLNQEFVNLIYEESQGIIDIAVKIYCMAQLKAISSGMEEITVELIKQVAEENLNLVKPMLNALKSGDNRAVAKYEDICTVEYEDYLSYHEKNIEMADRIKEFRDAKKNKTFDIREQAILKLIDLGINETKSEEAVEEILKKYGQDINLKDIVIKVLILINNNTKMKRKKKKNEYKENDLRGIGQSGVQNGKSAYNCLKERGYIDESYSDKNGSEVI